jgi:hypothetical protein
MLSITKKKKKKKIKLFCWLKNSYGPLNLWFPNFSEHQNYPEEGLLKLTLLGLALLLT